MTLAEAIDMAIQESKRAYKFVPNSYTYHAMSACLAAKVALEKETKPNVEQGNPQPDRSPAD
jgi:hypothetical protein